MGDHDDEALGAAGDVVGPAGAGQPRFGRTEFLPISPSQMPVVLTLPNLSTCAAPITPTSQRPEATRKPSASSAEEKQVALEEMRLHSMPQGRPPTGVAP